MGAAASAILRSVPPAVPPAVPPGAGIQTATPDSAAKATHAAIEAEIARVEALTKKKRAALGKKYSNAEELWQALDAGGGNATLLLRASWLKEQRVEDGFRLPKRGTALPVEATITVAELRSIARKSRCQYGALPVIALSHFWRTKENPDPEGETAGLVIAALGQHWKKGLGGWVKGVTDLGVIIDWCALWQEPRTPEQDASFLSGLRGINQWYAHQGTTVWLVTAGVDRVKGLSYWEKGWTSFEFALSMMIKPSNASIAKDWAQVVDLGREKWFQVEFARPKLSEPLAFFDGHKYGDKTYTNGADRDNIVAPKFRETIFEVMGGVVVLHFGKLNWGDADVQALAVVLPLCRKLTELRLHVNGFGNAGMVALASAMRARGSMAKLKTLDLSSNKIGDEGMKAFASTIASRSLENLQELRLDQNKIGDAGMTALAGAIASGYMKELKMVYAFSNPVSDGPVREACQARRGKITTEYKARRNPRYNPRYDTLAPNGHERERQQARETPSRLNIISEYLGTVRG